MRNLEQSHKAQIFEKSDKKSVLEGPNNENAV